MGERADKFQAEIGERIAGFSGDNVEFHGDRLRIGRGGLIDKNVRPGSIRELAGNVGFVPVETIGTFDAQLCQESLDSLPVAIPSR